jgi:hypothetical protein
MSSATIYYIVGIRPSQSGFNWDEEGKLLPSGAESRALECIEGPSSPKHNTPRPKPFGFHKNLLISLVILSPLRVQRARFFFSSKIEDFSVAHSSATRELKSSLLYRAGMLCSFFFGLITIIILITDISNSYFSCSIPRVFFGMRSRERERLSR